MGEKRKKLSELESEISRPDFWKNHERAQEVSQKAGSLRKAIEQIDGLAKDLEALEKVCQDKESPLCQEESLKIGQAISKLEKLSFLGGKYDRLDAILLIQSGAGGDDAEDWTAMLLRMYERYAERQGWTTDVLHVDWGAQSGKTERAGIKTVFFEVKGEFAYGFLKGEKGVHRLVRISPFSSQKLRHTSFALVDVLPVLREVDAEEFEIPESDIRFEAFRSSGPGGQNVNRRETAVRLTHIPTGISVACQVERTQERNRARALSLLRSRLAKLMEEKRARELDELRGAKISPEWGSQIRSYVLHPYTLVKDNRTGVTTSDVNAVLDGELGEFIEAELKLQSANR